MAVRPVQQASAVSQPRANPFDWHLKLLLVGDSHVGKTALLRQFASGTFEHATKATIGIDFKIVNMNLGGKHAQVQIWDTAGLERFRSITKRYFSGCHGILLAFDVTDRASFNSVRFWHKQIRAMADAHVNIVLVGNKTDVVSYVPPPAAAGPAAAGLGAATAEERDGKPKQTARGRQVSTEEGQALADEFGVPFFETSAKRNERVEECFTALATDVTERLLHEARSAAPVVFGSAGGLVDLQNPDDEPERGSCFWPCCPIGRQMS